MHRNAQAPACPDGRCGPVGARFAQRRQAGGVLLVVLAVVALLVAGGLFTLLWSLDAMTRRAIEREASRLTGTTVRVDSVDLELSAQRGTLRGLRVANPEGFSDGDVLVLDEVVMQIDATTAGANPFVIRHILISEPRVHLEIIKGGATNLDTIARHAASQPDEAPASGEEEQEDRRFVIEKLSVAGGEIALTLPDKDEAERLELSNFEIERLGGRDGASGGEIGKRVLQAFLYRVTLATAGHQLGRAVEKGMENLGEAAGKLLRDVFK